jgi:hypothetical protein
LSYTHRKNKLKLARQKGFEPLTYGLEGRCSIQLSYWRQKQQRVISDELTETQHSLLSSLDGRGEKI